AGWSDHVLKLFRDDTEYRSCCTDFLKVIDRRDVSPGELLAAYKLALARLILAYKPYVSPSAFLLDLKGQRNKAPTPEEMATAFSSGIDALHEFAPLPPNLRTERPELVALLAPHYETYRQQAVLPLIGALKSCHALIVLVDVTMLLAGGVGMYNDNRQIL